MSQFSWDLERACGTRRKYGANKKTQWNFILKNKHLGTIELIYPLYHK